MSETIPSPRLSALLAPFSCCLLVSSVVVAQDIQTGGAFVSTVPEGTAPLQVSSTTAVSSLNADLLDGKEASEFALKSELIDDGSLEINQDCAVNSGCFAGDNAGFPVTITSSNPASTFRVTSDLDLSGLGPDFLAIDVNRQPAVIDLLGHTISGPGKTPQSTTEDDGIGVDGGFDLTVRNGVIKSMGGHGVRCSGRCEFLNLDVAANGRNGVDSGSLSSVRRVRAINNGTHGILVSQGGSVSESLAAGNGSDGINASAAGVNLFENVSENNTGDGIEIFTGIARHNTAYFNDGYQINVTGPAAIEGNQMRNSDGTGTLNGGVETGENVCDFTLCSP